MKIPNTSKEVEAEILVSSDKAKHLGDLRIRQLIDILTKVDPEVVVDGVLRVFENDTRQNTYSQDQEFAGQVLEKIKPVSQIELSVVLSRVLKNWDKSVEQFPFLAKRQL